MACKAVVEKQIETIADSELPKVISAETFKELKKAKTFFPEGNSKKQEYDVAVRSWLNELCDYEQMFAMTPQQHLDAIKAIQTPGEAEAYLRPVRGLKDSLKETYDKLLLRLSGAAAKKLKTFLSTIGASNDGSAFYKRVHEQLLYPINKALLSNLDNEIQRVGDRVKAIQAAEAEQRRQAAATAAKAQEAANQAARNRNAERLGLPKGLSSLQLLEARRNQVAGVPTQANWDRMAVQYGLPPGSKHENILAARLATFRRGGKRKTKKAQKKRRQTRRRA